VLTLARCFSKNVHVTGTITWDMSGVLADEARRYGRLFWPHEFQDFTRNTDIIIVWGVPHLYDLLQLQNWKGTVIACSHGTSPQPFHRSSNAALAAIPGCRLVAVSDAAALSFPDDRQHEVTVIPNGVEADRCTPQFGREFTRRSLGVEPHQKIALFVSRLGTEKRPGLVAHAVLQPGMEDWVAVIAGFDIEGEGAKLPKHPRVKQIEPVDNVGDLLSAADVFILPSTAEAHPLALTEAWLSGTPTVYCDWGFASQIRRTHGKDLGVVVPIALSPEALASAMVQAAQGEHTADARSIAWENYTANAMAARWEVYMGVAVPNCSFV
jgi:glycosyltransferase involved in cell wall biosynthesis